MKPLCELTLKDVLWVAWYTHDGKDSGMVFTQYNRAIAGIERSMDVEDKDVDDEKAEELLSQLQSVGKVITTDNTYIASVGGKRICVRVLVRSYGYTHN